MIPRATRGIEARPGHALSPRSFSGAWQFFSELLAVARQPDVQKCGPVFLGVGEEHAR